MPTPTSERIRSRQERLQASMQAALDMIRQPLLEKCAATLEAQREMEQDLREELREGLERKILLGVLATVQPQVEREVEWFGQIFAIFASDPVAGPTIESQHREAQSFLAWLQRLEARFSAPLPAFDESVLSPVPAGPTAEGYIQVSEARQFSL